MTAEAPTAPELQALRAAVQADPDRPKLWRNLATGLLQAGDHDGAAAAWSDCLRHGAEIERQAPEAGRAFLERIAIRVFPFLAELVQTATVLEPDALAGRWALVRRLYADPRFAELAARFPDRFDTFVSLAGEDLKLKAAHKHGANISPLVDDALQLFSPPEARERMVRACRTEVAGPHGGLDEVSSRARRLLEDEAFNAPVVICGFHHSGTRLLARLMEAIGLFQRINTYQYEWSYANLLNTLLEPGCMDPDRAGAEPLASGLVSAERLAFRMAMAGLEPAPWGFKDPRNGLTAAAWLEAFPRARVLHIMRDPVATLGSLPREYAPFVRLDERRPSAVSFWIELWERYVEGARRAMSSAAAAVEIRFEDLCLDPAAVLQQATSALGLGLPVRPELWREVNIESGKTDLRARLRSEGRLTAADFTALETLAARYGYGAR